MRSSEYNRALKGFLNAEVSPVQELGACRCVVRTFVDQPWMRNAFKLASNRRKPSGS
jgi:hypothetical protein